MTGPPKRNEPPNPGVGGRSGSKETGSSPSTYSANKPRRQVLVSHHQEFADIDGRIEAAEDYERFLALKCFRVRKLILSLQIKRDALEDLGAVLSDREAA